MEWRETDNFNRGRPGSPIVEPHQDEMGEQYKRGHLEGEIRRCLRFWRGNAQVPAFSGRETGDLVVEGGVKKPTVIFWQRAFCHLEMLVYAEV